MWIVRGISLMIVGMGLLLASPTLADEMESADASSNETSLSRDSDAKRHLTCQTECENDGEDPYQCEEFCVHIANLDAYCKTAAPIAQQSR